MDSHISQGYFKNVLGLWTYWIHKMQNDIDSMTSSLEYMFLWNYTNVFTANKAWKKMLETKRFYMNVQNVMKGAIDSYKKEELCCLLVFYERVLLKGINQHWWMLIDNWKSINRLLGTMFFSFSLTSLSHSD